MYFADHELRTGKLKVNRILNKIHVIIAYHNLVIIHQTLHDRRKTTINDHQLPRQLYWCVTWCPIKSDSTTHNFLALLNLKQRKRELLGVYKAWKGFNLNYAFVVFYTHNSYSVFLAFFSSVCPNLPFPLLLTIFSANIFTF